MTQEISREELLSGLTLLGQNVRQPIRKLETFPNQHPGRPYVVTLTCEEFTCLCAATGQPDFATITIRYIPDQRIVESKSLKLYLWSFRDEGHFHEHVTYRILDDLVETLDPTSCEVVGAFQGARRDCDYRGSDLQARFVTAPSARRRRGGAVVACKALSLGYNHLTSSGGTWTRQGATPWRHNPGKLRFLLTVWEVLEKIGA